MSAFEVTQEQWEKLMMNKPSKFENANSPVGGVSWNDIERFCEQLTQQEKGNLSEGFQYRLPYMGEWEYACRAGTKTKYCFGDSEDRLTDYGWYFNNHDNSMQPKPVGLKIFNSWGLHDMHGNLWEWCLDRDGANAWVRGGGWGSPSDYCVSDIGASRDRSLVNKSFGFRIVLARSSPHQ
jgi:formylglycine-generating enzyme required for sulfatase activity